MTIYQTIETTTQNEVFNPTHNKIEVRYIKERNRGIHIFISKVDKSTDCESFMIMSNDNMNMLLKPLKRANKKALASVESVVNNLSDKLFTLYQNNDRKGLKTMLDKIAETVA